MSYVNNITGSIDNINTVGEIESITTNGNVTTITATAQIISNNVIGRLGFAQIGSSSKVQDVLVNGESVVDEQGNANIDTSEFIKNTVDNLVNYYLKSETYSKEEIDELANAIANAGYATEEWVKDQDYMPIDDFLEYINYFYYNKTQTEEKIKEEIDTKLEELPKGIEYKADDNIIIEDDTIKVFTNTGYKVSDKDVQLQSITSSGTTGTNEMLYVNDDEITVIYDGSNKIRRSKNGIKFDTIELPYTCKSMFYNPNSKKIFGLANGYFLSSDDYGQTWISKQSTYANNIDYIALGQGHIAGFVAINKSTKTLYGLSENFSQNSTIKSTISPDFVTQFAQYQHIWCNSSGTFKYGAGSQEGTFASLSGVTVNMLKTVNGRQIVGVKNSNKIYIIKNLSGVTGNEWVPYDLPDVCTVNDIIYNHYDKTYYIFTDINTYYKTKDFINFDSVDKNNLRGLQGHFTLMGIQMITSDHDVLLLAPTRTTLEDKAQEWDRALNKELWVGAGLGTDGIEIFVNGSTYIGVNSSGVYLKQLDEYAMPESVVKANKVATAKLVDGLFDPYNMDNWFWEEGYPEDESTIAHKMIFSQAGSFYDPQSYNEEYSVEQYEYGYLYIDVGTGICKYEKLGNLAWLFNMILGG